jgi:hypothetical protein
MDPAKLPLGVGPSQAVGVPPERAAPARAESAGHTFEAGATSKTSWGKTALKVLKAIVTFRFSAASKAIQSYKDSKLQTATPQPPMTRDAAYAQFQGVFNPSKAMASAAEARDDAGAVADIQEKLRARSEARANEARKAGTEPPSGAASREMTDVFAHNRAAELHAALDAAPAAPAAEATPTDKVHNKNATFLKELEAHAVEVGEGLASLAQLSGDDVGDPVAGSKRLAASAVARVKELATVEQMKSHLGEIKGKFVNFLNAFAAVEGHGSFEKWLDNGGEGRSTTTVEKFIKNASTYEKGRVGDLAAECPEDLSKLNKKAFENFAEEIDGNVFLERALNDRGFQSFNDWYKHGDIRRTPEDVQGLFAAATGLSRGEFAVVDGLKDLGKVLEAGKGLDLKTAKNEAMKQPVFQRALAASGQTLEELDQAQFLEIIGKVDEFVRPPYRAPLDVAFSTARALLTGKEGTVSLEAFEQLFDGVKLSLDQEGEVFEVYSQRLRQQADTLVSMPMRLVTRTLAQQSFAMYKNGKVLNTNRLLGVINSDNAGLSGLMKGALRVYNGVKREYLAAQGFPEGLSMSSREQFLLDAAKLTTANDRDSDFPDMGQGTERVLAENIRAVMAPALKMVEGRADKMKKGNRTYHVTSQSDFARTLGEAYQEKGRPSVEGMSAFLKALTSKSS